MLVTRRSWSNVVRRVISAGLTFVLAMSLTATGQTLSVGAAPSSRYFADTRGPDGWSGGLAAVTSDTASFSSLPPDTAWYDEDTLHIAVENWNDIYLIGPDGAPLQAGLYTDFDDAYSPDPGRPGVTLVSNSCPEPTGSFRVHEVEYASTGVASKLAVDIAWHCETAWAKDTWVALRYNSAVPATGIAQDPTVGWSSFQFGLVPVGGHEDMPFTFTNAGETVITFGAASTTGAASFAIHADSCSAGTLAPGASCQVVTRFSPTTAARREAVLDVPMDTPSAGRTLQLTGTGALPSTTSLDVSPYRATPPETVYLQAAVSPPTGGNAQVLFFLDGSRFGGATVDPTTGLASETIWLGGVGLASGKHTLQARFEGYGDPPLVPSESALVEFLVSRPEDVEATDLQAQPKVVYPHVDGYRDRLEVSGQLGEPATVDIEVHALPAGDVVGGAALGRLAPGSYLWRWDGRGSDRAILPAGDYDVEQRIEDDIGNLKVVHRTITLSHDYVTWTQKRVTLDARRIASWGWSKNAFVSLAKSRYPRGVLLDSGRGSATVVYAFPVVEKPIYGQMRFTVYGRSANGHKAVVAVWNPALGGNKNLGHYDVAKPIGPRQKWWGVGFAGQGREVKGKVWAAVVVWKGLGGAGKSVFDVKSARLDYAIGQLHRVDAAAVASLPLEEASTTAVGRTVEALAAGTLPTLVPAPTVSPEPEPTAEPSAEPEQPSDAASPEPAPTSDVGPDDAADGGGSTDEQPTAAPTLDPGLPAEPMVEQTAEPSPAP